MQINNNKKKQATNKVVTLKIKNQTKVKACTKNMVKYTAKNCFIQKLIFFFNNINNRYINRVS